MRVNGLMVEQGYSTNISMPRLVAVVRVLSEQRYLLRCVDHSDTVAKLQGAQNRSEDGQSQRAC